VAAGESHVGAEWQGGLARWRRRVESLGKDAYRMGKDTKPDTIERKKERLWNHFFCSVFPFIQI